MLVLFPVLLVLVDVMKGRRISDDVSGGEAGRVLSLACTI